MNDDDTSITSVPIFQELPGGFLSLSGTSSQTLPLRYFGRRLFRASLKTLEINHFISFLWPEADSRANIHICMYSIHIQRCFSYADIFSNWVLYRWQWSHSVNLHCKICKFSLFLLILFCPANWEPMIYRHAFEIVTADVKTRSIMLPAVDIFRLGPLTWLLRHGRWSLANNVLIKGLGQGSQTSGGLSIIKRWGMTQSANCSSLSPFVADGSTIALDIA